MSLHWMHTDQFKTTVVCLLLRNPLDRETATSTAIIPNILARGSRKYPTMSSIQTELEDMYGAVFDVQTVKKAEEQMIQLYIEFLSSDHRLKSRALSFVREILLNPLANAGGFQNDYVKMEKANLKLAIASRINNKAEYAKLRALEEMCRDERFGVYGDGYAEDVDSLTPENIYARYDEVVSNAPIELVIAGRQDADLERLAHELFPLERAAMLPKTQTGFTARAPRVVTEYCNVAQGKICMGYRTAANNVGDDVYRLMVFNEALGGNAGSRLFINVREKENLCYYINSFVYRAKAILFVQSGVDGKYFGKLQAIVGKQIKEIADGGLSDDEVSNAKKSLTRKIHAMRDSRSACLDFYMSQHMLGDRNDINGVMRQIERVGKDEVSEMAGKLQLDTVFCLKADE